jgi:hypothetical protein
VAGAGWTPAELARIDAAEELGIAVRRADGSLRRPVPVWVVRCGDEVYVRTWHRRDTGWYGRVLASGRARVGAGGFEVDVVVEDVGADGARDGVDAAYRAKYGRYGTATVQRMVGDAAAATTLRLEPDGRPAA